MAHVANVVIDNTKVSADLTDFVVYVDLSDLPASFWDTVANGGGDIRCFKSDGTTELAREVVSCDTATDTGELHIKFAGTLSSSVDTTIQIHADGSSSDYAVGATYGRNAVWSDYQYVGHLQTDGTDSTGNATASTTGSPSDLAGKIEGAQSLTSSSYYSVASGAFGQPVTLQCWAYRPSGSNSIRPITLGDSSVPDRQIFLGTAGGQSVFTVQNGAANVNLFGSTVALSTWVMLHGVYKDDASDTIELFLNGASEGTNTASSTPIINTVRIGASADSTPFGNICRADEARVRYDELSSSWIATEYNNQSSPSTFYTASAVAVATVFELEQGEFELAGGALSVLANRLVSLAAGNFTVSGGNNNLLTQRVLPVESGDFSVNGGSNNFLTNRLLSVESGNFNVSGGNNNLAVQRVLSLGAGSFSLNGENLDLDIQRAISLEAGSFVLNGGSINFVTDVTTYNLSLEGATFTLSGGAISPLANRSLSLEAGSFTTVGGDLGIVTGYIINLEAGVFVLTGGSLNMSSDRVLTLEAGDILITGGNLLFDYSGDVSSTIVMAHREGEDDTPDNYLDLSINEIGINLTKGKIYGVMSDYTLKEIGGLYHGRDLLRYDPEVAGQFWNNDSVLSVSAG